jgi:hypothetical protein
MKFNFEKSINFYVRAVGGPNDGRETALKFRSEFDVL